MLEERREDLREPNRRTRDTVTRGQRDHSVVRGTILLLGSVCFVLGLKWGVEVGRMTRRSGVDSVPQRENLAYDFALKGKRDMLQFRFLTQVCHKIATR